MGWGLVVVEIYCWPIISVLRQGPGWGDVVKKTANEVKPGNIRGHNKLGLTLEPLTKEGERKTKPPKNRKEKCPFIDSEVGLFSTIP